MHTATKYFGQVEYDSEDVLYFPDGLFGFEQEQRFLLLPIEGGDGSLLCLQSLQTPALAFTVMNPFFLNPSYAPVLQEGELKSLGVTCSRQLCFYVLCVVRQPVEQSTVNFKCPVAINDETRQAAQVILETTDYEMRHLLSEFRPKGDGGPC